MSHSPDIETPAAGGVAAGAAFIGGQPIGSSAADPIQEEVLPFVGKVVALTDIPAIARYAKRVGAKPRSLRKLVVFEHVGKYRRDVAVIQFDATGSITAPEGYEPTDEEGAAIITAWKSATWPVYRPLLWTSKHDPEGDRDRVPWREHSDNVAFCWDRERQYILAAEVRVPRDDGDKDVFIYSPWDDGLWRLAEPDTLPLYGLDTIGDALTIIVHEGPKGAKAVQRLIADDGPEGWQYHPWGAELRGAIAGSVAHVGWMGGAQRPLATDWTRITGSRSRVIIVADHDPEGFDAAKEIAKGFGANVFILAFDQQFERGFDLADRFPESLFDESGAYTGPALADFLLPATRATELLPPEGERDRPLAVLRREFLTTVAYTLEPLRFFLSHRPSRELKPDEFNAAVAPFSHVKDTATKVYGRLECQHDKLAYVPWADPGTVILHGLRCYNSFDPPRVTAKRGDPRLWLAFLEHLFPVADERDLVMNWVATLIAKPKVRMRYGLLLISLTQGVGKGTLGVILKRQLGVSNVSFPSQKEIIESQFNGWASRKRLAFIAEIYSGHSRKGYDELKPYLTDDDIPINEKNLRGGRVDNWLHVIACSNSDAALHLDDEDRRWFVPTVAETKKPPEWWRELHAWLAADGAGVIRQWALDRVKEGDCVRDGDEAPPSPRKTAVATGSRSEGQKLAIALGEHIAGLDRKVILRSDHVRKWVALRRGFKRNGEADVSDKRLEKVATILAALRKMEGATIWADAKRVKFAGVKESLVMNFAPGEDQVWADVKEHLTTVEGVGLDEEL